MLKSSKPLSLVQVVCVSFITPSSSPLSGPPPPLFCPGSLVAFVHNILSLSQNCQDLMGRWTREMLQASKGHPLPVTAELWRGEKGDVLRFFLSFKVFFSTFPFFLIYKQLKMKSAEDEPFSKILAIHGSIRGRTGSLSFC